jgi:hypothetical protein
MCNQWLQFQFTVASGPCQLAVEITDGLTTRDERPCALVQLRRALNCAKLESLPKMSHQKSGFRSDEICLPRKFCVQNQNLINQIKVSSGTCAGFLASLALDCTCNSRLADDIKVTASTILFFHHTQRVNQKRTKTFVLWRRDSLHGGIDLYSGVS